MAGQSKQGHKLKVLGIAGSPRRGGNTELLLKEVLAGAASSGAETKLVILSELKYVACRHCDGCLRTGRCVITDDMQWIHSELREADRFVLASPIFFMGVTAQAKAMIDRCQALWMLKHALKLPVPLYPDRERRGLFVSTGGTSGANLFKPAIATVKIWYNVLDVAYSGDLLFPGVDEKEAILQHPSALKDAFLSGQRLVEDVSPAASSE